MNELTPFQRGVLRRITVAIVALGFLGLVIVAKLPDGSRTSRTSSISLQEAIQFDSLFDAFEKHAAMCQHPVEHKALLMEKLGVDMPAFDTRIAEIKRQADVKLVLPPAASQQKQGESLVELPDVPPSAKGESK